MIFEKHLHGSINDSNQSTSLGKLPPPIFLNNKIPFSPNYKNNFLIYTPRETLFTLGLTSFQNQIPKEQAMH